MKWISKLLTFCIAVLLWSCTDSQSAPPLPEKPTVEKTVAVVLPMEKGLETHWRRCLSMFVLNFERAFKQQEMAVRLNFEFYDETSADIASLSESLAGRDDVYAVIGGLYSSDAAVMASQLTRQRKTFFTLATSEQLVRAFASTGYLWAMTETDITQCEVLLSKVVNYGGKSVALIAKANDIYGNTFIDWFAFQARELGLENKGVYPYEQDTLEEMARRALQSGAEYVICVPSEIDEIGPMLASYDIKPRSTEGLTPRLIFSDTGYGTDVLTHYGPLVEGMEGVAFGADPESGFDISYRTFYGEAPTTGEAQLYDAAMLLGYAAWMQHLRPDLTLQTALRDIVTGQEINMGTWTGEDMSLVVDALARGDAPYVRGASGQLRFDSKIFTNVLATTYYNYKVYNGQYIILDYNTSDGGNRTDATLAGWNWKVSQMQDFEDSSNFTYPPHSGNWAVLVAASRTWTNYRHQADVLAIYRQLRLAGFPDERIILIAEDDLAYHTSNPTPGEIRISPGGPNVHENIRIDYRLSDLTPQDFLAILKGERSVRLPYVIEAGEGDNIFVFWSGHGVPGAMCWDDEDYGLTGDELAYTLEEMNRNGSYRKILLMIEACYSGGVASRCEGIPGVLLVTAANGEETSKADVFSSDLNVWMSNRFTSTFIQQITENSSVALRDLYYRLFVNTVGSHVMVYNARHFGNLYTADMSEFIIFK